MENQFDPEDQIDQNLHKRLKIDNITSKNAPEAAKKSLRPPVDFLLDFCEKNATDFFFIMDFF